MVRFLTTPSASTLTWIIRLAAVASLAFMIGFQFHDRPLQPHTIISYEFAWNATRATQMFAEWGAAGNVAARESLWIDFGFMPAYALFVAGLTLHQARQINPHPRLQTIGLSLALVPGAAVVCDVIENLCLLVSLPPALPADQSLFMAGLAATIKFSLLFICTLYWLFVFIRRKLV